MKTKGLIGVSVAALLAAATITGAATASGRNVVDARTAAAEATKAGKALTHHRADDAVAAAESAVALAPRNAEYRLLLGQSYMAAGRFASARTAFADTLTLSPVNAKAALDLVLMQIGTGDWAGARRTLDEHGAVIAGPDRGLALALAGDPAGAVQLLTQVVRAGDATPKARQNLALALALAGQWSVAKAVAAVDLSPADVDARLEQWAAFARPRTPADQVATLLSVTPVEDHGQPAQLALVDTAPSVAVAATVAPVSPVIAPPVERLPAPAFVSPVTVPAPAPAPVVAVTVTQPGHALATVTFAPRAEVVQPLTPAPAAAARAPSAPAPVIRAAAAPVKVAVKAAPAKPLAKGSFFVQLGAFNSAAVAEAAWHRAIRRLAELATQVPSAVNFATRGVSFYRLSVGGYARADADALCRRYHAIGGACFVRARAGDRVVAWAHPGARLAATATRVQLAAR